MILGGETGNDRILHQYGGADQPREETTSRGVPRECSPLEQTVERCLLSSLPHVAGCYNLVPYLPLKIEFRGVQRKIFC